LGNSPRQGGFARCAVSDNTENNWSIAHCFYPDAQ
jgi:hypothetical protein